jgi:hypothetical protein
MKLNQAMLGVTGFETSANFVEEQKPGVYPRTLRNMVSQPASQSLWAETKGERDGGIKRKKE